MSAIEGECGGDGECGVVTVLVTKYTTKYCMKVHTIRKQFKTYYNY